MNWKKKRKKRGHNYSNNKHWKGGNNSVMVLTAAELPLVGGEGTE